MSLASASPLPSFVAALVGEDHHVSADLTDADESCDGSPSMTKEEYRAEVQVIIVLEPRSPKGAVPTFWMHTYGLVEFGLPELELRNVPALYIEGGGDVLNTWGYYMVIEGRTIKAGENLGKGGPVPLTLRAAGSTDPFWWKQGVACIRLEVEAVHGVCEVCGGACSEEGHGQDEDTDG